MPGLGFHSATRIMIIMRLLLAMLIATLLLGGCSGNKAPVSPADAFANRSAEQIFQGGEQALVKKQYQKAIQHFEALDILYPFGVHDEQAQLDLIFAYYQHTDYAQAAVAASRFIRLYPRSQHVDYAYYMRGMANFNQDRGVFQRYVETDLAKRDLGTAKQAYRDFMDFIHRYPNSAYAADARERMIYLRNLMARHELLVARFYYRREAYVAAVNRCLYLIEHYQQAPEIVKALELLVLSYQELELPGLAQQFMDVLAYNYPDSQEYKQLLEKFS